MRTHLPSPPRPSRALVAIDPGLDGTGLAYFHPVAIQAPLVMDESLVCLREVDVIGLPASTGKGDDKTVYPLHQRLLHLHQKVGAALVWWRDEAIRAGYPDGLRVLFEMPATAGGYAERLRRQRGKRDMVAGDLAAFNMAIGALLAGISAVGIIPELIQAPRTPKDARHLVITSTWSRQSARMTLPQPRNKDQLCAVWLGTRYLSET